MAPPETLWQMQLPSGSVARCVLVPGPTKTAIVSYVDEQVAGVEEFSDLQEARIRAQELRDLWRAHGSIESIGFQD